MPSPLNILLVAPSGIGGTGGNFGDPHLVSIASCVRARTNANVEILSLEYEALHPQPYPEKMFSPKYDVIGISCYSSYNYLESFYLGCEIRKVNPRAVIVVGGYHPSARPGDFLNIEGSELEEESPFDYVVVGEGEAPFTRIVESVIKGERLATRVLGPEPIENLDDLPPLDWSLMDRYRKIVSPRLVQATISLSRGCPFKCSFCMERCKGEQKWRAFSPGRSEKELKSLFDWLGKGDWLLFLSEPLFGLNREWRHEVLARIEKSRAHFGRIWALSRVDLLAEGDIERYNRAGFGLGFGLESGDPQILQLTAKVEDPNDFYERFMALAKEAARVGFPWGANVIAGHPGESEASIHKSAEFARRLFLGDDGLTGSLSVDPFRFYPGSQIDKNLPWYEEQFGTKVHRKRWWNFSEQSFCSEWIDPSSALDYRKRSRLTAELYEPIFRTIADKYTYSGPDLDYYYRGVERAVRSTSPQWRLGYLDHYFLWQKLTGNRKSNITDDAECVSLFKKARKATVANIERECGELAAGIRSALINVPREKFVPANAILRSWMDESIVVTRDNKSIVSAMHAYARNYSLLELGDGDCLLDVGCGTGYGSALADVIVGENGHVLALESLPALAQKARKNLEGRKNIKIIAGDWMTLVKNADFNKVHFGFAVKSVPSGYLDALPEGGLLVAPVVKKDGRQELVLFSRKEGKIKVSTHGEVIYVEAVNRDSAVCSVLSG